MVISTLTLSGLLVGSPIAHHMHWAQSVTVDRQNMRKQGDGMNWGSEIVTICHCHHTYPQMYGWPERILMGFEMACSQTRI